MSSPDVTVFVCVSCRKRTGDSDDAFEEPGRGLLDRLEQKLPSGGPCRVAVAGVECLAVCKRPCTVALTAENKWTYVVGDLDAEANADDVVAAALSFGASENGIIPWRERPLSFRKGVVARVPPMAFRQPDNNS